MNQGDGSLLDILNFELSALPEGCKLELEKVSLEIARERLAEYWDKRYEQPYEVPLWSSSVTLNRRCGCCQQQLKSGPYFKGYGHTALDAAASVLRDYDTFRQRDPNHPVFSKLGQ